MTTPEGETVTGEGTGDGAVDALLQAINAATGMPGVLKEYHVAAVTPDTDALGEVSVLVELDGRLASGQGVSTDTLEASARAYLRGAVERAGGRRRRGAEPLQARRPSAECLRPSDRRATSPGMDGERLIRFGADALDEAPDAAAGRGASTATRC